MSSMSSRAAPMDGLSVDRPLVNRMDEVLSHPGPAPARPASPHARRPAHRLCPRSPVPAVWPSQDLRSDPVRAAGGGSRVCTTPAGAAAGRPACRGAAQASPGRPRPGVRSRPIRGGRNGWHARHERHARQPVGRVAAGLPAARPGRGPARGYAARAGPGAAWRTRSWPWPGPQAVWATPAAGAPQHGRPAARPGRAPGVCRRTGGTAAAARPAAAGTAGSPGRDRPDPGRRAPGSGFRAGGRSPAGAVAALDRGSRRPAAVLAGLAGLAGAPKAAGPRAPVPWPANDAPVAGPGRLA